jgi:DNA-directed RNA polymerase specialized sigma24 family protein
VLRHYEHLKFHEIAEVLQIPEGTVKSRMAEGLAMLGRKLKPALSAQGMPMAEDRPARRQNV